MSSVIGGENIFFGVSQGVFVVSAIYDICITNKKVYRLNIYEHGTTEYIK